MFGVFGTLPKIRSRDSDFQVHIEIAPVPARAVELDFLNEIRFDIRPPSGERPVHTYLLLAVDLFRWLPGWGAAAVLVSVAFGLCSIGHFMVNRFENNINEAIRQFGEPLCDAQVEVQSIEPAEKPAEISSSEIGVGEEELEKVPDSFEFGDDIDWFSVEATIVPRDRGAAWNPRALELVSSDFDPTADFEVCEQAGALQSLEVWRNGEFVSLREGNVSGPQRLRMLFAIPQELRHAKFAYQFTCIGSLELPNPVAACS